MVGNWPNLWEDTSMATIIAVVVSAFFSLAPGLLGYEGQPGNQGGHGGQGLLGYEGQPGNQGGN
jgi:hypothetical protein